MMPPARTESALYLDQASEVDRFLDQISDVNELALDTEGASFHRFLDRIYLLQISTREHSAIIDPLPIGSPAKLGQLLQSNRVQVVFLLGPIQHAESSSHVVAAIFDLIQVYTSARLMVQFAWNASFFAGCL